MLLFTGSVDELVQTGTIRTDQPQCRVSESHAGSDAKAIHRPSGDHDGSSELTFVSAGVRSVTALPSGCILRMCWLSSKAIQRPSGDKAGA